MLFLGAKRVDPAGELGLKHLARVRREKSIEILSQPKPSILAEAIYFTSHSFKKNSNWLKASSKKNFQN